MCWRSTRRYFGRWTWVTIFSLGAAYLLFRWTDEDQTTEKTVDKNNGGPALLNLPKTDGKINENNNLTHSAIRRYCNYPLATEPIISAEEMRNSGLKLRGLSIVTRHGDRAPLTRFSDHLPVPFCGLRDRSDADLYKSYVEDLKTASEQELLLDSLKKFRKHPPTDQCRPGHLTVLGVVQMLRLGRALRRVYGEVWPFDDRGHSDFYMYTTTFPRTYQSALAFLTGVLGRDAVSELNFQGTENVNFCTESWCKCANLAQYNGQYHAEQWDYYKKRGDSVQATLQRTHEVLRNNATLEVTACFDHLVGYACHQERLPSLSDGQRVTDEMLAQLHGFITGRLYETRGTVAASKKALLESLPIMARWRKLLNTLATSDTKSIAFQYFSAHDVTLGPLLIVLDVFDGHIPPYASNLRAEVWQHADTSTFYLRFVYNGDDVTQRVKFCDGATVKFGRYELCDAQRLSTFLRTYLDDDNKPTDAFKKLCSSDS